MKIQAKLNHRGTTINKINIWDVEDLFENLGLNIFDVIEKMADDKDYIYISNGFVHCLTMGEVVENEYHHYFVRDAEGDFTAETFYF